MEVNSSFKKIEKFSGRPGTISLKEFKATSSTAICELKFKYGANYTEAFAFKQLAHYVHYEALDVYKQHFLRTLGVTQIPNPTYATTIATASQASIAHHGFMPNNPNPIPTLVNLSLQQLIAVTANIPPTIDAPTFADLKGEFFLVLELEFSMKNCEEILQFNTFSRQKDETLKMLYKRFLKFKKDTQSIIDLEATHWYFVHWKVIQHSMHRFYNEFL
jgi:hypothetical protein